MSEILKEITIQLVKSDLKGQDVCKKCCMYNLEVWECDPTTSLLNCFEKGFLQFKEEWVDCTVDNVKPRDVLKSKINGLRYVAMDRPFLWGMDLKVSALFTAKNKEETDLILLLKNLQVKVSP